MNYNTTGWENLSGMDSLIAINRVTDYLPVTLFVLVVGIIIWMVARSVTDTPEASFLTMLMMALISIPLAFIHLLSPVLPGIASVLTLLTMVMMIHKNRPESL